MAGHSKWSQIKRKKAILDSKRSQAFTKIIKEISLVARAGGGDPDGNPRLRTLLEKARAINMPTENAQRAIQKGTGELPGVFYEQYIYEGYGPHGTAIVIESLTDNKNRSVGEIRHYFNKNGGTLADGGAVMWMFKHMGVIKLDRNKNSKTSEDDIYEMLLEHNLHEVESDEESFTIIMPIDSLENGKQALEKANIKIESAELEYIAQNKLELEGEQADQALEFLDGLSDLEDVQNVYTNLG
jgi:YebC/PmpR family DNA-binding regulatory protein